MYYKMLRQFSKGSLISISSEPSKIHFLIKVLYRHFWFNLCRQYFLFYTLNISLLLAPVQLYNVLVLKSLQMKYFSFANVSIPVQGVTQISNLPAVFMRPTHPVRLTPKCQKLMFITFDIKLNNCNEAFLSFQQVNK